MSTPASTSRTPAAPAEGGHRLIDPRGHRFGAGLSVVILVVAFLANLPILVAFVGLALAISALFGTQYSLLGKPWPTVRRVLKLGPPSELESEYPPRFAQALGTIGLGLATLAFVLGVPVDRLAPRGCRRGPPAAARGHRLLPRLQALLPAVVRARRVRARGPLDSAPGALNSEEGHPRRVTLSAGRSAPSARC